MINKLLQNALNKNKFRIPNDFVWHLHSMDVANLVRIENSASWFHQPLAGYSVHVDDRYPRWITMLDEQSEHTIDAYGMVEFSRYKTLEKPTKSLAQWLREALTQSQRNALLPEGFHWYLNPLTVSNLQKDDAGVLNAQIEAIHPDDTTYVLFGYRVRNDQEAPKGSHIDILQYSIEMTNNDQDWYAMWARKWNVDRKTAKYALNLYVHGPQNPVEKRIIKTHYANTVGTGVGLQRD